MFDIIVKNGSACKSKENETVLSSLAAGGIALSAPCGGRGICGKCRVILQKGKIKLTEGSGRELGPGDSFPACQGIPLSDITIEIPPEDSEIQKPLQNRKVKPKKILRAGVGIDIGTTTVQAELVDLETGESLETATALNAQRSFGADVMSRIDASRKGKTKELFTAINRQIEEMLRAYICDWKLTGIEKCVVSANTAMLHLFCNVDPSGLGEVPFTPVFLKEQHFSGRELNLSASQVTTLPGISAFVGADIVSGLALLDILRHRENAFFVDIGTNGEMALWKAQERRLLCTSTAAGPCFEGAEISCGMSALPGAINRIEAASNSTLPFNYGPIFYSTLGNAQPQGICGSGLVDAIAALKKLNAIDETGALCETYSESGFFAAEGIAITQKDIRQFQLAKSAILSGINILCKRAGFESKRELKTAYIAGGLGFFIDLPNAVNAGLLPAEFAGRQDGKSKTIVCGNTSLKGAVKCLFDPAFLPYCRSIAALSETESLAAESDFAEAFAENMYF